MVDVVSALQLLRNIPLRRTERHRDVRKVVRFVRKTGLKTDHARPLKRDDCMYVMRPCPFVGCKYNTYLTVKNSGSIVYNFSGAPTDVDADKSCVLDMIEIYGSLTLDESRAIFKERRKKPPSVRRQAIYDELAKHESHHLKGIQELLDEHYGYVKQTMYLFEEKGKVERCGTLKKGRITYKLWRVKDDTSKR